MRLTVLECESFRSLSAISLPLGERLTYLGGWNDVGKSSVIDAVQWLFLGRCRGIDGKGAGVADLHPGGSRPMVVTATFEDGTRIRRMWSPATREVSLEINDQPVPVTVGQQALWDRLNVSPDALSALLRTGAFLHLDQAEAFALLLRVLDAKVPSHDPAEAPIHHEAAQTRYQQAFTRRTDVRRTVKNLTAQIPADAAAALADDSVPTDDELRELDDQLTGLRAELGRKEQNAAKAAGVQDGRRSSLEQQVKDLDRAILADTQALGSLPSKARTLAAKEEKQNAIKGQQKAEDLTGATTLQQKRDQLQTAISEDGTKAGILHGQIAKIPTETIKTCVLSESIACPANPAVFTSERIRLQRQLDAIERSTNENQKKLSAIAKEMTAETARAGELATLAKEIGELLAYEVRRKGIEDRIADSKKKLEAVRADLDDLPAEPVSETAPIDPAIVALRERVNKGEQTVRQARELSARVSGIRKTHEALKKEQAILDDLEKQVGHYGPEGAAAASVDGVIRIFVENINEALGAWGYALEIQTAPWKVFVNGRDAGLLAKSVRHRVGICVQLAIADLTGVGFVAIDEADMLDDQHRETLLELLIGWTSGQALVAGTARADFRPMTGDGVRLIRLELADGRTSAVLA